MHSDTPLDHALFQLSPRRSRCELFVHGDGKREMIASGLLKPFLSHLKVADEQAAQAEQSIKLDVDRKNNVAAWFSKGTLDRFVRFVSTPDVLEMVNTLDAEMSQLEGARRIYAQGAGDEHANASGERGTIAPAAADVTKKELLRAIDLRLAAVKQDLTMATGRASAAGFTLDSVSALLLFADRFGAHRLNEACTKFISLCQRRPELISHQNHLPQSPLQQWKGFSDEGIRSSSGSDMSIDEEIEPPSLAKPLHADAPVKVPNSNSQPSQSQRAASEPPPSCQEGKPFPLHFVGKEAQKDAIQKTVNSDPLAEPAGEGPPRRLSLKDRINFFESKQKEQSKGSSTLSSGPVSGNRVLGGKAELRRLQSDVSAEKLVLRRWSGASDMSIDLSSSDSRKDSASAAETPTSSSIPISQCGKKIDDKEGGGIQKTATSLSDNSTAQSSMSSSCTEGIQNNRYQNVDNTYEDCTSNPIMLPRSVMGDRGNMQNRLCAKLVVSEKKGDLANHNESRIQSNAFMGSTEAAELSDQQPSGWEEDVDVKGQIASQVPAITVATSGEQTGQNNKKGLASQTSRSLSTEGESVNVKDQSTSVSKFRTSVRKVEEAHAKPQGPSGSAFQSKHTSRNSDGRLRKDDSVFPQNRGRTFPESTEGVEKKDFDSSLVKEDGLTAPIGVKSHEHTSEFASNDATTIQRKRIDTISASGGALSALAGRKVKEGMEVSHLPSIPSLEQAEMVRPSKGNQQLKDELQMKADELEKLFAAHKLRIHGDQMAFSRRGKTAENQVGDLARAAEKRPSESLPDISAVTGESLSNGIELNSMFLLKVVDNPEYVHSINKLGNASDDHRGKFYQTYMQKRAAKLREELGSKGAQKEAKMKAMQDILERSQAEMKAKFAGSPDQQSLTNSRRRVEKLRSYNAHATKSQKKIETFVQDEEGMEEPAEEIQFGEDKYNSDAQFSDGSSRSSNSKKLSSNKNVFSSAPRTSAAAMPRSSTKTTLSGSARRRTQPENPLAQSVPNFSDLRKENTKPPAGVSKVTTRGQAWNFARSKITGEETKIIQEDKARWSESMKKSTAGVDELKDLSPLNSDNPNTVPSLQFDEVQKNGDTIASSRKGNGLVSVLRGGAARSKVPRSFEIRSFEIPKDEEELEGLVDQPEKSLDMDKHDNVFEGACSEGNQVVEFTSESGSEKPRMSPESGMSEEFQTDNGDVLGSPFIVSHHVPVVSSKFNPSTDNVQESPGQSIVYWNSHVNQSFSYPLETSDVDVSVDSPASPSSWNSHPLNEIMDAEAARIRKKWGAAQIPIFVANASHQHRKDVSKGFKRLLKFGRKSRGSEGLLTDYVSASTASEGDDDAEDGQDVVARPSDELRKSRMGYPFSASDAFDESETFQDQAQSPPCSIPTPPLNFKLRDEHLSGSSLKAPRSSFFSLSNFRSKGSESKLR